MPKTNNKVNTPIWLNLFYDLDFNSNIKLMIELLWTAHLGQVWLRSPSDKNGWFTLQNPTIRLFLTANGNNNPTIEGKTYIILLTLIGMSYESTKNANKKASTKPKKTLNLFSEISFTVGTFKLFFPKIRSACFQIGL